MDKHRELRLGITETDISQSGISNAFLQAILHPEPRDVLSAEALAETRRIAEQSTQQQ